MNSPDIDANSVRGLLPLTIEHCSLSGPILAMGGRTDDGQAWTLSIVNAWSYSGRGTVIAWGDAEEWLSTLPELLIGEAIVDLEGPADLFDASLRFSSGALIRQLCSDEDVETWFFSLAGRFGYTGPGTAEHRNGSRMPRQESPRPGTSRVTAREGNGLG